MSDTQTKDQESKATVEDLDLIDDALEDEGKDDEELWGEIDAQETAAANGEDADASASAAAGEHSIEDQLTADIDSGKTGRETPDQDDKGEQGGEADSLWAGANDEQRKALSASDALIKKLEQSERSNRGRVSTLQRQLNDITRQLDQGARPAPENQASDGDADGTATNEFLESKDWKDFAGEYPEVAGPLSKVVSAMQSEITGQKKQLDAIGTDRLQDAVNEQTELLVDKHPDWQDAATDPLFGDWLEDQPRHMREAAVRNAKDIVDAGEAADVISRFKAFRLEQGDSRPTGPGDEDDGEKPSNESQETVTSLSGKRKRQLESSSGTRPRGAGAATGIPADGDEEAIWDAFDKQEARASR